MKDPFELPDFLEGYRFKHEKKYSEEFEEPLQIEETRQPKTIKPLFDYKKLKWFFWGISLVFLVLISRTYHLQIVQGSALKKLAEENRLRKYTLIPTRGVIYDRERKLLVKNIPSFDLMVLAQDLPSSPDERNDLWRRLSQVSGIPEEELKEAVAKIRNDFQEPQLIKKGLEREAALILKTKLSDFPGIFIKENPIREYEQALSFSHLIGYLGPITSEKFNEFYKQGKDYTLNDFIGQDGLEFSYEEQLRGKAGQELFEVDSRGTFIKSVASENPLPGNNLILSIDSALQEKTKEILEKKAGSRKAAVVAINPKNGEVLTLVSLPSYDNNLFAKGITPQDFQQIVSDERQPLFNRAISGVYPPGSTIKPVVAAAALEEGIVSESSIIEDKGRIDVPHEYNPDIIYHFYGWNREGLGPMNIYSAMAKSSDIYFYVVGGGFEEIEGLGVEKLADYFSKFNLGSITGIDLPNESSGLVPNAAWKEKEKKETWYLGDTYHMAIGQGDLLVTPLQVTSWTATIANGGTLFKPHVVSRIEDIHGKTVLEQGPVIIRSEFISQSNIQIVRRAMREVVLSGSGKALSGMSFSSAGKTGTAELGEGKVTHAWYTAFAPYEDPEIALTVLVEEGGEGHATAVPIAGEILKWYFSR